MSFQSPVRWQHFLAIVVGFLLLAGAVGLAGALSAKSKAEQADIRRTLETRTALAHLLSLVQAAETGQRGYLLTGNERYLEDYRNHLEIGEVLSGIRESTDGTELQPDLNKLEPLIQYKLSELSSTIAFRQAQELQSALDIVRMGTGKSYMDQIRSIVGEMTTKLDQIFAFRQERFARVSTRTQAGIIAAAVLIALIAVFMVVQVDRRARRLVAAEASARDSDLRFRLLSENLTDMVVLSNSNGVRRYVSPACRDLLGYEPSELIGTRPHAMVHPEEAELFAETMMGLQNGATERATSTHRFLRKDGRYVWVEMEARLLCDSGTGVPTGFVSAVRDVSERHRRAEELRAAMDAAEAGLQAKGDFLASISHELRTPLNGIIGFTGLMIESGELQTPLMRRYARLVQDASTTLLSIVNDVLDVSKLDGGKLDLDPHPFSPRDLVENVATLLQGQAEAKGLALHVETDPSVPAVLVGDDGRLRQVLLNLLSNAVKFTAKGMVWVFVGSEEATAGTARVRFSVMDTGIGIPHDRRHLLFKRFSQVDSSTSRQFGGTGLGLSICKSLVELMGGTMVVDSVEGEGTTFSFVLDLPVAEAIAATSEPAAPVAAASTSPGAHILLAEDVEMNQELAVALLNKWGHTVEVVADGAAAVDAVMRARYDLVLMDVQMPVMDGIEATRRIRALGGSYTTMPIVAMTANVMARDIAICRETGFDDHIGKPFVPETLRLLVARMTEASERPLASTAVPSLANSNPTVDMKTYGELSDLLGPARLQSLLIKMLSHLEKRPLSTAGRVALRFEAHALMSSSGTLGLRDLSQACHALEMACAADDTAPLISLDEAQAAAARAETWLKHHIAEFGDARAA